MISETGHGASRAKKARAAVKLLDDGKQRDVLATIDSSAMRNLQAVAQAASSLDEIVLVIQYQQARQHQQAKRRWDAKAGKLLIDLVRAAAEGISGDDDESERSKALAAAEQLGLVARAHKVISEEARERSGKGGKRKGGHR